MSREIRGDPRGFIDRVDSAIQRAGLQVYEFSEEIGRAGSYWSQWKNRHREREAFPRADTLMAMKSVLKVPLSYLLGLPPELGEEDTYPAIAPVRRPLSDAALMLKFGAEPVPDEDAWPVLEEFTASARHGRGNLIPQNYDEVRPKRKPRKKGEPKPEPTVFKLRVSGDCLRDTVQDGEVVWFDTTVAREPVALVFVVKDEHEVVDRLGITPASFTIVRPIMHGWAGITRQIIPRGMGTGRPWRITRAYPLWKEGRDEVG